MATCNMQQFLAFWLFILETNMHVPDHAAWSHLRWHAKIFYLSLHEFRMALVDLHLLELILPLIRVQQAAGL